MSNWQTLKDVLSQTVSKIGEDNTVAATINSTLELMKQIEAA
jgi:hypothetical protein